MRLKSLEIVGFKSFADPFRIDFRRGISSIVGPNGCGKSNVADALRWVLGTQSPKQIRAEKMESVIFSGSTKRKQLGMAEVTLTFDNTERSLGLDYDEVSVTRKLFRSGESEYSINGSRCRLMDITDLIVDRGLGSTGYWILESKMVGTILSSRPEDRRFLFDEAAGIVKYKIQRHRAELKLESAASDLERLADIISEVDTGCQALKRQVSAYRKHERVTESIRHYKEAMNLIESTEVMNQLAESTARLEETGAVVGRETAALAARSAVLAEARTEFGRVQGKLDEAHGNCARLDSALASCDREIAVTREKIEASETRIAENRARMARERERLELYSRDIEELQGEKDGLAPAVAKLEVSRVESMAALEEIRGLLGKADGRIKSLRDEKASLEEELEKLRNGFMAGVRKEEARLQRISWLENSLRENEGLLNDIRVEKGSLLSRKGETETILKELRRRALDKAETAAGIRAEKEKTLGMATLSGRETAVLEDRAARISRSLEKTAAGESISGGIVPLPGMGKALGAFLYGFDSAVLVDTPDLSLPGDGSLYAMPLPDSPGSLPKEALPLHRCVESCSEPAILAILSRGVLAPDRESAVSWIRGGLSVPVVTPAGDIFRPEGFIRMGVEPESAGSLELSQILSETREELQRKREVHNGFLKALERLTEEAAAIDRGAEEAEKAIGLRERELAGVISSLENAEKEELLLENKILQKSEELKGSKGGETEDSTERYNREMAVLQRKKEDITSREEELLKERSGLEGRLAGTLRDSDGIVFSLREKKNREKEIEDRISMLNSEEDRIQGLMEELSASSAAASAGVKTMKESLEELEVSISRLKKERGEAESVRSGLSVERNRLMESTAVLEKEVQQIRDRLGRSRSAMIELEAVARSLGEKLKLLEGSVSSEENPYLGLSQEELKAGLDEENRKLERIGPVNMLAVKEYEDASGRLSYLTEQREDLDRARASLSRAIREINEEAAQRFDETFEKVRSNFREMFVKLFGGGEGDIVSIEGEDPLEGGIEIMARPKGKKLKNVIALSDGEKAMTAVALLFSLYLVKPSPFCVLDELDSPFDDSNTDKFIAILREFSGDTQFIVITHNKRTMEGSDVLYGVTMAEEGVSNITSVNLEEMVNIK